MASSNGLDGRLTLQEVIAVTGLSVTQVMYGARLARIEFLTLPNGLRLYDKSSVERYARRINGGLVTKSRERSGAVAR